MTDTIREQIISAIVSKLAIVRTANGYNTDCGRQVYRAQMNIDPDRLPAIAVYPGVETVSREYSDNVLTMPIGLQAIDEYQPSVENASEQVELMLGDLIEAMAGKRWTVAFTSGGSYEPKAGHTVTGATSAATAYIESVSRASGSWAGGDAAGTLTLRRKSGTFEAENLNIGSNTNVCTINGTLTYDSPENSATDDFADDIIYIRGGTDEYPKQSDSYVGCVAEFEIIYRTLLGNPYAQPD